MIPLPNRDNLNELRFLNDKENSGVIYYLPFCQSRINKHPHLTTKEWLITKKVLKEQKAIQALLKSDNFDARYVVVKIGDRQSMESEYLRSRLLYTNGVKGFVPYICMFHCADDKNVYEKRRGDILNEGFCGKETSSSMYALVMPYLASGSLEELIPADQIEFDRVKRIICSTISNLRNAINTVGFIHGDCSFNNVFPAFDKDGNDDSYLIDFGHAFVIPRHLIETKTAEELIGYSVAVYKDFAMMLAELGALYLKRKLHIIGLPELQQWVHSHFKPPRRLDVEKLKNRIMALTLDTSVVGLAPKSRTSVGMGPIV